MSRDPEAPLLRRALWALLIAVIAAVAVAFLMAGRWTGGGDEPPPVIATLPDFELVNRDGSVVTRADLAGAPWIADLIFTRCSFSCPRMTERMKGLGAVVERHGSARRVSLSVDPVFDTPEVLATYAAAHGVKDPDWLFLTGEVEKIRSLALEGFLLPFDDAPPPEATEPILHSTRFVLVDAESRIRGYYDAFLEGDLQRLVRDLRALG